MTTPSSDAQGTQPETQHATQHATQPDALRDVFGLWRDRDTDGLRYQQTLREEWPPLL